MRGALLALAAAGVVFSAAPALAHDDNGVFTDVQVVAAAEPLTATVRARLVYANDGDPVPSAAVTVDAVGPAGVVVPAVAVVASGDGSYEGAIVLTGPGAWTVRLAATVPVAATEAPFTAEPPPTTTAPRPASARAPAESAASSDSHGSSTGLVIAVAAAVVIAAAGASFVVVRRR